MAAVLPFVFLVSPALAQTASPVSVPGDLNAIVRAQAARIEAAEARLRRLEEERAVVVQAQPAPSISAPASPPRVDVARAGIGVQDRGAGRVYRFADPESAPPSDEEHKTTIRFVNGLPRVSSDDGRVWFRPRGRLFLDASTTSGSTPARNISGTSLASVRLGFEGAYGKMAWALEGDFSGNEVVWKSAFANFRYKVAGLEAETSIGNRFNDRTMDGSAGLGVAPFQTFNVVASQIIPRRGYWGVGLQERLYGKGWHVSVQATGEDPNNIGDNDDGFTLVGRGHWNPVASKAATLHLGAWAFRETLPPGISTGVVRSAALAGDFNTLVRLLPGTTGVVRSDTGYGLELALVAGPFWTQSEWGRRRLYRDAGDLDHHAYSIDAGVFLFGAVPPYDKRRGVWGRAVVDSPVTDGGLGALSIQARYENADYSRLPLGGHGDALTIGSNWHLNGIARVMFDVTRWRIDNLAGATPGRDDGTTLNTRFQLQF
jgi:phosphate-selective porin OprO/OprP